MRIYMELLVELIKSILYGIIQGITEWLPISSTGHLILAKEFFKMNVTNTFWNMFLVLIQLGSILAVVVLFFHKLNPFSQKKDSKAKSDTWQMWFKICAGSIPAVIIGALAKNFIETKMRTPLVVAITLILYGILFIIIENLHRKAKIHKFNDLTYLHALAIGAFQTLAFIPGTSRSGATILGAILIGCSRVFAAEYSFFLAIPAMFGASVLDLGDFFFKERMTFTSTELWVLIVGMVVSFVVSLFAIKYLLSFIKKHDFKPFGYYRIIFGLIILLLTLAGIVNKV